MEKKSKSKVAVFIDGSNIFYTQKHLGWTVDWKKVKAKLEKEFDVVGINYYTGIRSNDKKMEGYLKYLRHLNIKTITKPLKTIVDNQGKIIHKSNMDVEIVVDVLLEIDKYDQLILFSGDSDFVYLVKVLQRQFQKRVFTFSSRKTISWELKLSVDKYFFLKNVKNSLNVLKNKNPPIARRYCKTVIILQKM